MPEPIKIRAQLQGDQAEIKALMNHPMETGLRKDPKTGQLVPLHFIQQVVATLNGKTVLAIQWSQAISKNPFLGFRVKGAKNGDKVMLTWWDNHGESNSIETTIA